MRVNGKHAECSGIITVADIITANGHNDERIAVELNGRIVPRSEYSCTLLNDNDSIEIVKFVGGG
jgi:thiamine biosynthesis protein ThiS